MSDPFDSDLIESLQDAEDRLKKHQIDYEVTRVEFFESLIRPKARFESAMIWFLRLIVVLFFALGVWDLSMHDWFMGCLQFVWVAANLFNLRSFTRIRDRRKANNAEWEQDRQKHLAILAELDPAHELVSHVIEEAPEP